MKPDEGQPQKSPEKAPDKPSCSCAGDPFASLPPALKPRSRSVLDDLIKVTCQGCGLTFRTNRKTEYCAKCEEKLPGPAAEG
jgi:hypothetical protein